MKNKSIVLISDNYKTIRYLSEKLVLLRNNDEIAEFSFGEMEAAAELKPDVVLLDSSGKESLIENYIKLLKKIDKSIFIILLSEISDPEFIAEMYDCGIDDYILPSSTPADVLIKMVNIIKHAEERKIAKKNEFLLKKLDVISSESGFYTERCANELIYQEFENISAAAFMIVTYDELDRTRVSLSLLQYAVKNALRASDTVIELKTAKFYILLPDSDVDGAVSVFEKIKAVLNDKFRIKAGIVQVMVKDFKYIEQRASAALTDAMLSANDYCIYTEKDPVIEDDGWNIEVEKEKKDFKLFHQKFIKKLENVITPVFYRLQKVFENELPETKIEQSADELQCIFHLKSPRQTSRLTLVYPGLAKVVIYITHSGLDSPENREIIMSLKELTEKSLSDIICSFVEDYKTCMDI